LFGILALQSDMLDAAQFAEACSAWAARRSGSLADLLVERGWLTPQDRVDIERLLERKLQKHRGDVQASLADVQHLLADPVVQQSLNGLAGPDPNATQALTLPVPGGTRPRADVPTLAEGRFRILRTHRKGGLGELFVAYDAELHREVALKEMQPRYADLAESRARFLLEAEITGGLEHPGIVPVYSLSAHADGRPFYAMRFIQGDSLKEAMERFHATDEPGRDPGERRLAFGQMLRRFLDVCNAVSYAHSRGVLHRDLKPGNVMLGPYGETLLVDWGLAKVAGRGEGTAHTNETTLRPPSAEEASPTQAGQALGTPAYMSPEQAAGRLDELSPATDVYGLGATLYAMLTGQAPFQGRQLSEVLARVQVGDFPPPRRVKRGVSPALEAVCLKAMALSPMDRYASPRALADDIEHWLADEPVSAYGEPGLARLSRWGRRHRATVASAALLLLTAVVGLALGLVAVEYERQRTARERDDKEAALTAETKARAAEAQAHNQALAALRSLSDQLVAHQLARGGQVTDEDKEFLHAVLKHYEAFAAIQGNDADSRAIRAEGPYHVGRLCAFLGEFQHAQAAHREALGLRQQLVADYPARAEFIRDLAKSHNGLGLLLEATGRPNEAEAAYREALRLLKPLAADSPTDPELHSQMAANYNNLGILLWRTARLPEAEAAYRDALGLEKRLTADFPSRRDFGLSLAQGHNNLANLLVDAGRLTEAEAAYRAALALYQQLATASPTRPEYRHNLALSHHNLASVLRDTGRRQEAEASFRAALGLYRHLAADFPTVPTYAAELAGSHNSFGLLLRSAGRLPEAETAYRAAVAVREQLATHFPDRPDFRNALARSSNNLGNLLRATGRRPEAEATYRTALALGQRLATDFPTHPEYRFELARSHNNLGALLGTHEPKEAEAAYRAAVGLYQQLATASPTRHEFRSELAMSHHGLGVLLRGIGRLPEAEKAYRAALALQAPLAAEVPNVPTYRQELAKSHHSLGNLLKDRGMQSAAEAELRQALGLKEKLVADFPAVPDYRHDLAQCHHNLGLLLAELGKPAEAEAAYRQALTLAKPLATDLPRVPVYRQFLAVSHTDLGRLLEAREDWSNAEAEYHEAIALREQLVADFPGVAQYAVDLGGSYGDLGRSVQARGEVAASLGWYTKARAILLPVLGKEPHRVWVRQLLCDTHTRRALALAQLGRHAAAVVEWEQARALNDEKARDWIYRLGQAESQVRIGQPAEAVAAAEEVLKLGNPDRHTRYNAACVYSLAVAQAMKQAPPNTSSLRAERYARRAVALLRQAVQQGFQDVGHIKKDSDLDALRGRDEFKQLLAQLEAKTAGPGK
jgi:serine/threonine-protein kinase